MATNFYSHGCKDANKDLVSVARALKFLLIRHGPLRPEQLNRTGCAPNRPQQIDAPSPRCASPAADNADTDKAVLAPGQGVGEQLKLMNETMAALASKMQSMGDDLQEMRSEMRSEVKRSKAEPSSGALQGVGTHAKRALLTALFSDLLT